MDVLHPEATHGDATPEDQLKLDTCGQPILDRDKFDCPNCRSTSFSRVTMPGRSGKSVELPFFACDGCTVVFMDAWRFKRLLRRSLDHRGFPSYEVTRGPDDRPMPYWTSGMPGNKAPGGYRKTNVES